MTIKNLNNLSISFFLFLTSYKKFFLFLQKFFDRNGMMKRKMEHISRKIIYVKNVNIYSEYIADKIGWQNSIFSVSFSSFYPFPPFWNISNVCVLFVWWQPKGTRTFLKSRHKKFMTWLQQLWFTLSIHKEGWIVILVR